MAPSTSSSKPVLLGTTEVATYVMAAILGACATALILQSQVQPELPTAEVAGVLKESFPFYSQPFMATAGDRYRIFRPLEDLPELASVSQLLAAPEQWVKELTKKFEWLDHLAPAGASRPVLERARAAYTQAVAEYVSGVVYREEERTVIGRYNGSKSIHLEPLNATRRAAGIDWTYLGDTMTGVARLNNVIKLVGEVVKNNISGAYIETGVWRGGSSMLARAALRAHGQGDRLSYVCDSFSGLPVGDKKLNAGDMGWNGTPYLEVDPMTVATGFKRAGVLDPNVVFCKGFFNDSMPVLSKSIGPLAIIRFDGDMYRSAVDVLYHIYDKLEVGGFFIVDDWNSGILPFPSRVAVEDFFAVHGIRPKIIPIDNTAVYWKKTEKIEVQKWRYAANDFKKKA